jgi:hypothetical protein
MSGTFRAGLAAMAVVVTGACAATTFDTTWKAPGAAPLNFKGRKVAALVMSKDESVRYGAEDVLARELTARGAVGLPAYGLIPKELTRDQEKAKAMLDKAGVVGVVAMRVVGKEKELNASGGGYWGGPGYSSFWAGGGYYGYGWGGVYDPGYIRTDTIVSVETLVFSLEQDKLVWAGRSQTTNPDTVGAFIKELTAQVAKELQKQGLIGKK